MTSPIKDQMVLDVLRSTGGPMTVSEIASRFAEVDRAAAVRVVRHRLEILQKYRIVRKYPLCDGDWKFVWEIWEDFL